MIVAGECLANFSRFKDAFFGSFQRGDPRRTMKRAWSLRICAMHERLTPVSSRSLARVDEKAPSSSASRICAGISFGAPAASLSRAAKQYRVLVIEEPLYEDGIAPTMDISRRPGPVTSRAEAAEGLLGSRSDPGPAHAGREADRT
jgi:hypothetical protein